MAFVPAAFHPTRRAGTLFGVPVTRETYKSVLYDYEGDFYRPSGLGGDNPEMRVTHRCRLCGMRRYLPGNGQGTRYPYMYWPSGTRDKSGACHHDFRYTGVEVRVLRPDGTLAWRRPWLLRPGDKIYTFWMYANDVGWGRPKGTFRIVLCRPLRKQRAGGNPDGARQLPVHTLRMLFGRAFGDLLVKA